MPSLLRFLVVIAIIFGLGHAGRPEAARDHRHGAARQIRQAALRAAMPRPPRTSPQRLTGLFLDMLAAERGAGPNTLEAYTRDLDDLAAHLAGTKTTIATPATADLRAYLGTLAAGSRQGARGAPALGDPPALPFPLCGRTSPRRSGGRDRGAQARARAAESALDRRGRPAAGGRACGRQRRRALGRRAAARAAPRLPAGGALRDGLARLRADRAPRLGGTARRAHAGGARQGRQRAAGVPRTQP